MFHLCNVVLLLLDCFYFGYFVARMMQIWYLVLFPGSLFEIEIRKGLFRTAVDLLSSPCFPVVHNNATQMYALLQCKVSRMVVIKRQIKSKTPRLDSLTANIN